MSMSQAQEIAEILTAFTEEQRRAALNQHRWRKITLARVVGDTQIQCETVVDEEATDAEVYGALASLDAAVDRLKAKADLVGLYEDVDSYLRQIEVSVNARTHDRNAFLDKNRQQNAGRRNDIVGLTEQQLAMISRHSEAMRHNFEEIEKVQSKIADAERVVAGEGVIIVRSEKTEKRLDALRGERQDAA